MGKYKKKRTTDVYKTDIQRLSVYPSYNHGKSSHKGREELKKNSIITVRVTQIDDNGHPSATYRGYRIRIIGEANPGDKVKVLVKEVRGLNAIGTIISREESYNIK
ncbi:MAG: hypothetical protein GSR85_04510 [Desulfurococcales archaeon]|nr:hypothetical protein [Desulfurococcales archaeon]